MDYTNMDFKYNTCKHNKNMDYTYTDYTNMDYKYNTCKHNKHLCYVQNRQKW